ncbi:hypothetical protein C356_03067 [Cryptococcus neoformans c45]|nr:hypothetical protein C356_03067 [Cryptococcus neoformans var. grubii c45]
MPLARGIYERDGCAGVEEGKEIWTVNMEPTFDEKGRD